MLGSSTPADPLRVDLASGRRRDSASARTAPPLRRGLVVGSDLDARQRRIPNENRLM
ncbi:hypothetical protein STTU_6074 [Streptomyces sp. Tu6071]|nr:hypothetical protein STTU_6074 [Streptomyces sp. Tu6071]